MAGDFRQLPIAAASARAHQGTASASIQSMAEPTRRIIQQNAKICIEQRIQTARKAQSAFGRGKSGERKVEKGAKPVPGRNSTGSADVCGDPWQGRRVARIGDEGRAADAGTSTGGQARLRHRVILRWGSARPVAWPLRRPLFVGRPNRTIAGAVRWLARHQRAGAGKS